MSFLDLLGLVRNNILEGMAHADVPFHKVTEALNIKRDSSRTSVFQAMFALQERNWHSLDDIDGAGLRFELDNQNHNTSKFEVHLQLRHDGNMGLEGDLHIATDLFSVESGQRMVEMFQNLVRSCLDTPTKTINELSMITKKDLDLIERCNSTAEDFHDTSVLDFDADLDNVALIMDGTVPEYISFRKLRSMISSVSSFLLTKLVQRQDRIGLLVRSSPSAIAAIYGVVQASCSVVILDPEKTPVERCKFIFDDANVNVVLVDHEFWNEFEDVANHSKDRQMYILSEVMSTEPTDTITSPRILEEDVFGIFYTSGTTGKPKVRNL